MPLCSSFERAAQRKHNIFFSPGVFCPISFPVCLLSLPSVVFHWSPALTSPLFHCVHRVAHFNSPLPLLPLLPPLHHHSSPFSSLLLLHFSSPFHPFPPFSPLPFSLSSLLLAQSHLPSSCMEPSLTDQPVQCAEPLNGESLGRHSGSLCSCLAYLSPPPLPPPPPKPPLPPPLSPFTALLCSPVLLAVLSNE